MKEFDFDGKWKQRLKKINGEVNTVKPKVRYEEPKPEPQKELYNIRRIVLPGGDTKTVGVGFEKEEAWEWVKKRLKPKITNEEKDGIKMMRFFEIYKQDNEHSIYRNEEPITKEEGSDDKIILEDSSGQEIQWQG